jgi:BRO family, N-terminal domain
MNKLIETQFEAKQLRMVNENGNVWFVAKDVCNALGIKNSRDAISVLDEDEVKGVGISDTLGKNTQTASAVNESGLYALIIRSNKPQAKKFRKWVTSEVLPQIRKTGKYEAVVANKYIQALDNGYLLGDVPYMHKAFAQGLLGCSNSSYNNKKYRQPQMFVQVGNAPCVRAEYVTYLMDYRNLLNYGKHLRTSATKELKGVQKAMKF